VNILDALREAHVEECPECQSKNIKYLDGMVLLTTSIGKFKCNVCGCVWEEEITIKPKNEGGVLN
jgi:rubredoxin